MVKKMITCPMFNDYIIYKRTIRFFSGIFDSYFISPFLIYSNSHNHIIKNERISAGLKRAWGEEADSLSSGMAA